MGTIGNAIGTNNSVFTGTSQYSTDFQNVITRAVAIASLPINQLNSNKTTLQDQSTALTVIDSKFAALQAALDGIDKAVAGGSLQASLSDAKLVSASAGDGAYASSLTASSWVNAQNLPGQQRTYRLWVGNANYDITPADNSAATVAAAINATAGGKVRASVVNVGSSSTPDWRISLQGAALGDAPVDLLDGGVSLQTKQVTGRPAQYVVDHSGVTVSSTSRAVVIADGLTVNLLTSNPGNPAEITVTRSTSALSDALATFASAYNDAGSAIATQQDPATGALSGQAVMYGLRRALSGMATYESPGNGFGGLADLGVMLGSDGKMTYNPLALMSADVFNAAGVTAFLGSEAGGGFLQAASNMMTQLEDPATGSVKAAEAAYTAQMAGIDQRVADKQDQVDQLQQRLQEQMSAADAAIASMEQQYNYLYGMFQAMQTAAQQYK